MQKAWAIDTDDGHKIHGLLNTSEKKNDKAVLIVHGMTGSPDEPQNEAAAQHFSARGYDVIRPYLYCMNKPKPSCRIFQDVTIAIHANDIDTVMNHFAPNYAAIYGAGHSYGGPSILTADANRFKAICLWDPSFKMKAGLSNYFVKNKTGQYVLEWERDVVVGADFMEENRRLDRNHCIALAKKCRAPLRVIFAGDGDYITQGESYHNFVSAEADAKTVEGTEHCFIEPGTTKPLLQYTREWFEKFQP
jgi:dienelactone hydrolase